MRARSWKGSKVTRSRSRMMAEGGSSCSAWVAEAGGHVIAAAERGGELREQLGIVVDDREGLLTGDRHAG
jgi:hypothetical protein